MKRKKAAVNEMANTANEIKDAIMDKVGPMLDTAADFIDQAGEQIAPIAHDAKVKGAKVAHNAVEFASPRVETASEKLQKDLMPKISDALKKAAEMDVMPTKKEMKKMQKEAAKLAAKAQEKKSGGAGKTVGVIAALAAIAGASAVLLKKFLGSTDATGWAAHEPSKAYIPKDTDEKIQDTIEDAKRAVSEETEKVGEASEEFRSDVADAAEETEKKVDDFNADEKIEGM